MNFEIDISGFYSVQKFELLDQNCWQPYVSQT